jgi:hypothetical protein
MADDIKIIGSYSTEAGQLLLMKDPEAKVAGRFMKRLREEEPRRGDRRLSKSF